MAVCANRTCDLCVYNLALDKLIIFKKYFSSINIIDNDFDLPIVGNKIAISEYNVSKFTGQLTLLVE